MVASFFGRQVEVSRAHVAFDHLLDRMERRCYRSSLQTLAFYWLRTVRARRLDRSEWKILSNLVSLLPERNSEWRELAGDLENWIRRIETSGDQSAHHEAPPSEPARPLLNRGTLAPYMARLLNEWLPMEVARLLVDEPDDTDLAEEGIPGLAIGRAIERLLVRERLSAGLLESLLQPGLFSPRFIYPADAEILRDVVLFLLGRTESPAPEILPAVLLCVAPDSSFAPDYAEAVASALLRESAGGEELHVPIGQAQAAQLLRGDRIRISSIVVTMDGRWWHGDRLLEGDQQHVIVYRPKGRLRIDYSEEHARLRVPWPEGRLRWSGAVDFGNTFELFGREWRVARWEQEAERTWLELEFRRALPITKIAPVAALSLRRSKPASVDMAWAALEKALSSAVAEKSVDAIEQLRHAELIPLGRAIFGLAEAVVWQRPRQEVAETRLRSIAFLESELVPSRGRVPWRILPEAVRARLLTARPYRALAESLGEVFEGYPTHEHGSSPSHAA